MKESLLNVKMYSTQNCQEIIDEICDEYPNGRTLLCGVRVWIARKKEEFLKQVNDNLSEFDHISHALTIGGRRTSYHLIQKGTRFGIYSGFKNSIIIHPIKYIQIVPIDQGKGRDILFAALDKSYKWGVLKGKLPKELVPFEFDDIKYLYPSSNYFSVKNDGKWGIYDSHKKELNLSLEFDDLKSPINGFYPVKHNGKWGLYYPKKNDMVIDPIYDDADIVSEGLWAVKKDGKWGFVDVSNNIVVPFEYEWVSNYICGYAHASKSKQMHHNDILFDDEILLDHQGRRVYFMNPEFYDDNNRQGFEIKKSYLKEVEYYYVVDKKGNIVIPINKYRYLGNYSEGLFAASLDGKKLGFIDIEENIIIPFKYNDMCDLRRCFGFHWGIASVGCGYSYILINQKNECIFPYTFYGFMEFKSGQFSNGHWEIGERIKSHILEIIDIINFNKGKNMSYLIKTEKEVERDRERYIKELNEEAPYEWTAEDAWDAMTDGMYGDYPGGDIDYEKIGF